MLERDSYPPGVPCWIDTAQPDPEAATRFYGDRFGWTFVDRMPSDMAGHYAWTTYICVDDANATARTVLDAGGRVLVEPFDMLDAGLRGPNAMIGRTGVCSDPTGAVFALWQPNRHRGAQLVIAPGTWNWSDLYTPDIEGAKDFYGAVFGWQARTVNFGGDDAYMWRLPGYADHLETLDPGVRERHADFGAPEGFSDAIGWMMPMAADDGPPTWSVTFSVDDADAVAERAARRGGTVLMPPTDAGPVRMAVLRDPQGAVFTVSRFDPGASTVEG